MGLHKELEGILVVSLEQAVAAPYCGLLLADAGARVIKVERPEGDFARGYDSGAHGQSTIFAWLNRGKESICLDLNEEEDATLLVKMLARADVMVSNLAPGALERRGFSGDVLRKANPGLITCTVTGYGTQGDAVRKKAYDSLVQAESGICSVTGTPDHPSRVGVSLTDLSTGLTAFSSILRALHQRYRTGVGIDLELSMFDVMADWMNMALLSYRYYGGEPPRSGLTHSFVAPYGAFDTKDGKQIMLSIQNNREWAIFCQEILQDEALIDCPDYQNNTDRVENKVALAARINAVFLTMNKDDMLTKLEDARIACASLNSVAEVSDHPFLRNRSVEFADMQIKIADLPVQTTTGSVTVVPALGQHTASLRDEFSQPDK
jgi:formyl-CoA transferase